MFPWLLIEEGGGIGDNMPFKGFKHSEETKALIRAKRKLQTNNKGGGNFGKQSPEFIAKRISKIIGQKRTLAQRLVLSKTHIGQKAWNKGLKGVQVSRCKGKKGLWHHTEEWKRKASERMKISACKNIKGAKSHQWRQAVFLRDGYKCTQCPSVSMLEADHILPKAMFQELKYSIENGRTLCNECHRKTPTFGTRLQTFRKQHLELDSMSCE